VTLFEKESNAYDPLELDVLIKDALESSRRAAGVQSIGMLASFKPQLSLQLFVDEEPVRAVLHLNAETVRSLATAGASIDFDPYIYS
jgi:hypothetical protein